MAVALVKCVFMMIYFFRKRQTLETFLFFVRGMAGADDCVKVLLEFQFLFSSSHS